MKKRQKGWKKEMNKIIKKKRKEKKYAWVSCGISKRDWETVPQSLLVSCQYIWVESARTGNMDGEQFFDHF